MDKLIRIPTSSLQVVPACRQVSLEVLRQSPFFADTSSAFLTELASLLEVHMFTEGDVIMREGEIGDKMYWLQNGQVEVLAGGNSQHRVAVLGKGSIFGEMALFSRLAGEISKRTATVRAMEFSDCRSIGSFQFFRLLRQYPQDHKRVEKVVKDRLAELPSIQVSRRGRRRRSTLGSRSPTSSASPRGPLRQGTLTPSPMSSPSHSPRESRIASNSPSSPGGSSIDECVQSGDFKSSLKTSSRMSSKSSNGRMSSKSSNGSSCSRRGSKNVSGQNSQFQVSLSLLSENPLFRRRESENVREASKEGEEEEREHVRMASKTSVSSSGTPVVPSLPEVRPRRDHSVEAHPRRSSSSGTAGHGALRSLQVAHSYSRRPELPQAIFRGPGWE
eukprot:TRINITY_DN3738_c0_g1_i1.p1 TRINITY_DN3738_c0_g1~~TRINITY_DN3738_c0_g1_i1.p1  ORF type:complete len:388 (+),score=39.49 TRINITY_DN3738_c0_g1_i1:145-1308(+)